MKKFILTISLAIIGFISFGQYNLTPEMINSAWLLTAPMITNVIKEPLTKEIINKSVPKIIFEDYKGAVLEISDAVFRIKNVKLANKEFLTNLETDVSNLSKYVKKQDYFTLAMSLVTITDKVNNYIKTGTIPTLANNTDGQTKDNANTNNGTNTNTEIINELEKLKKEIDEKKQNVINNIKTFMKIEGNYETQIAGFGAQNLKLTLQNTTNYQLDYVIIKVTFAGSITGKIYCEKEAVFKNITKETLKTVIDGPTCPDGKSVTLKIMRIVSAELGIDKKY